MPAFISWPPATFHIEMAPGCFLCGYLFPDTYLCGVCGAEESKHHKIYIVIQPFPPGLNTASLPPSYLPHNFAARKSILFRLDEVATPKQLT
jgi:hypothetical protein